MPIKVGVFAQSKMDGAEEIIDTLIENQRERVEDKYSGEVFEIERNSDFITIFAHNCRGC